jgi:acetate kinase
MGGILVVNAGSTSVKLRLLDREDRAREPASLAEVPAGVEAVGHRIVHDGGRFAGPALLDDDALAALEGAAALAPLHNAPALRMAREARAALPGVPQVAVFDTTFHATLPHEAATYALPERWRTEWGIRRYGFHGLSVQWAVERIAAMLDRPPDGLRAVVCHLGGGASATAVRNGRSVDTSMGLSPLEGLVMAARAGSLDPDVPLHLILRRGLSPEAVEDALNHESGLRALAGTGDMREVEAAAARGVPGALRALEVHDHRLAAVVAGMAASLGGLDVLCFTGGVGEGSARTRAAAAARLGFLGVAIDDARNGSAGGDVEITAPGAGVRTLVVHAREDVVIARAVRAVLAGVTSEGRTG